MCCVVMYSFENLSRTSWKKTSLTFTLAVLVKHFHFTKKHHWISEKPLKFIAESFFHPRKNGRLISLEISWCGKYIFTCTVEKWKLNSLYSLTINLAHLIDEFNVFQHLYLLWYGYINCNTSIQSRIFWIDRFNNLQSSFISFHEGYAQRIMKIWTLTHMHITWMWSLEFHIGSRFLFPHFPVKIFLCRLLAEICK